MNEYKMTKVGQFEAERLINGRAVLWFWNRPFTTITTVPILSFEGDSVRFSPKITVDIELPPPSETLLSLLRHFHTHRAVAPLLDRLIEEYPQLEEWVNPAEIVAAVTEGVAS